MLRAIRWVAWGAIGVLGFLVLAARAGDTLASVSARRDDEPPAPPLSGSFLGPPQRDLVLGFAGIAPERMREGVTLLRRAIDSVAHGRSGSSGRLRHDLT